MLVLGPNRPVAWPSCKGVLGGSAYIKFLLSFTKMLDLYIDEVKRWNYTIINRLVRGAFCTIYLYRDKSDSEVTIKLLIWIDILEVC